MDGRGPAQVRAGDPGGADSGTKRNGSSEADLDVPAKLLEQRLERGEEAEALPRRQLWARMISCSSAYGPVHRGAAPALRRAGPSPTGRSSPAGGGRGAITADYSESGAGGAGAPRRPGTRRRRTTGAGPSSSSIRLSVSRARFIRLFTVPSLQPQI